MNTVPNLSDLMAAQSQLCSSVVPIVMLAAGIFLVLNFLKSVVSQVESMQSNDDNLEEKPKRKAIGLNEDGELIFEGEQPHQIDSEARKLPSSDLFHPN